MENFCKETHSIFVILVLYCNYVKLTDNHDSHNISNKLELSEGGTTAYRFNCLLSSKITIIDIALADDLFVKSPQRSAETNCFCFIFLLLLNSIQILSS